MTSRVKTGGSSSADGGRGISEELLSILACPKCRQPVTLAGDGQWLLCGTCRLLYEIRDGIPVMLVDEAKPAG